MKNIKYKFPLRVGRKQKRAVLDREGIEVVILKKGDEEMAQIFCDMMNKYYDTKKEKDM